MSHLKFTKTHEWIKSESDNTYTIGITDHAQSQLGDIVFVELPAIGTAIQAKESMGVIESVKAAADVYAPISGKVMAINTALASHPELINTDPCGQGWLVKITAGDQAAFNTLLDPETYIQTMTEEH